jgi:hypothetical protein
MAVRALNRMVAAAVRCNENKDFCPMISME